MEVILRIVFTRKGMFIVVFVCGIYWIKFNLDMVELAINDDINIE